MEVSSKCKVGENNLLGFIESREARMHLDHPEMLRAPC